MLRDLEAYAIQFLSRDCVPDDLAGGFDGVTFDGAPFSLTMKLEKGGLKGRSQADGKPAERRPLVAYPWPTRPSIGAVEYIDPYYDARWPIYLHLHGTIHVIREDELSEDDLFKCCDELRNVLWGSFETMDELKTLIDQRMWYEGYRWTYATNKSDNYRNPFPNPNGKYKRNYKGAPTGPGFAHIPSIPASITSGSLHDLAIVWSQGFSVPPGAAAKDVEDRAQRVKRHWNSYEELGDAERSSRQGTVKNTVRSAASAVDAVLRFYCGEWGIKFPKSMPFDEKIDQILQCASRPAYSSVSPDEATKLLHLYRARSSMHEGDCYFRHKVTGSKVIVDRTLAREFFASAQKFVLWIDSLG